MRFRQGLHRSSTCGSTIFMKKQKSSRAISSLSWKERPLQERPRERLAFLGPPALQDDELIALVFGSGATLPAARLLLEQAGGMTGIRKRGLRELCTLPGVGYARACQLKAALELGRRALRPEPLDGLQVRSPKDIVSLLQTEITYHAQEWMHVFGLDTQHRIRSHHIAAMGQRDQVLVAMVDIFQPLLKEGLSCVLIAHNHPSGLVVPSVEDKRFTAQVQQAAAVLHVTLLDHLIVSTQAYFSFVEAGLFEKEFSSQRLFPYENASRTKPLSDSIGQTSDQNQD